MKRFILPALLTASVLLAVAAVAPTGQSDSSRPDCPGKITCPLTGAEVCRDRCPLQQSLALEPNGETSSAPAKSGCCSRPSDQPSCWRDGEVS